MEERILRVIRQARRQLGFQVLRDRSLFWLGVASVLAALVLFVSLFVPFYQAGLLAAGLLVAGLLTGMLIGFLKRPTREEAAMAADRTGLSEHVSTALELQGREDLFSRLQREETIRLLEGYPLRERLKKPLSRRSLAVLGGSLALSLVFFLIPTRAKLLAEVRHDLLEAKKEEIEKIEEKLEELEELGRIEPTELSNLDLERLELSEADQEAWKRMLAEGRAELEQAENSRELEEMVRRLEKKEQQIKQQIQEQQQLADGTDGGSQSEEAGKPFGSEGTGNGEEAGEGGTTGSGSQEGAGKGSETGTGSQKETGSERENGNQEGSGQGEGSSQNPEAGELAETGGDQQTGAGGMSGAATGTGGAGGITGMSPGAGGTGSSHSAIASAGNPGGSGASGSGSGGNSAGGSGAGEGSGEGGSGEGSGGTGEGSGSGAGGSGSGQGGDASGGGWNHGSSVGIERDHTSTLESETVILPGQIAEGDRLTGAAGNGGTSYLSPDQVRGEGYAGTKTEYEAVLGSYSEKAYGQIERNEIPSDMQEVVKKYFSGLGGK